MRIQAALKEAGLRPAKDIAKEYGISSDYLRSAASKRGISLAFSLVDVVKKPWSAADSQFLKQNAQCMTAKEVGKHLNRTEISVKSKAKQLGVFFQKYGEHHHLAKYGDHDVELCRALDDEGLKPFEIAEKMELDYSYVQCILKYRIRRNG
ncbi:hypothetical protein [Vibrio crassostreae]|uniref:hypothetical protein n=1 Tax=Vibrio crassostreae TaxID=246167 RepID=UPI0010E4F779|nr:hypothetical protein [Vibrio crassostreae]TCW22666.1 hypothetical protein EDB48_101556 [Vibrio crassostreae]